MMVFLIWVLTAVMLFDCIALVLLVLIQLPKKEAGAGLAFGGGATDALFGAGSGNVLTKITKYAAGTFFVLSVVLSMMWSYVHRQPNANFMNRLQQPGTAAAVPADQTAPPTLPAAVPPKAGTVPAGSNSMLLTTQATTNKPAVTIPAESTNLPAAPATGTPK